MKRIVLGLLVVLVSATAFAGGVPPIPPNPTYSEPTQIIATLNA